MVFIGEALGEDEAAAGRPFVGKAGSVLNRTLKRVGIDRSTVAVTNVIWCRPPDNKLSNQPYEEEAISHCTKAHLAPTLSALRPHVAVTLGATATKWILGYRPRESWKHQDWHGTANLEPGGRFTVVPTFHPAFIARGKQDLTGAFIFDLRVAQEALDGRYVRDTPRLTIDPDPKAFDEWATDTILNYKEICVDIETTDKRGSEDEAEESGANITRINFARDEGEGYTVPWTSEYLPSITRLLASGLDKIFWHKGYDVPKLHKAGQVLSGVIHDAMLAWKVLRSALPMGLGFVAPFYSTAGPWKHLNDTAFETYSAMDAVQTMRCWRGILRDLSTRKQRHVYDRHIKLLDERVLWPAKEIGITVSQERLGPFKARLSEEKKHLTASLISNFPQDKLKLVPKEGRKTRWIGDKFTVTFKRGQEKLTHEYSQEDVVVDYVEEEVSNCFSCGGEGVRATHKCPSGLPSIGKGRILRPRYYVREPFNPNGDDQIRAYMESKNFQARPAKGAKTNKPSTGKKVLEAFARKDPFFQKLLEFRATEKIYSTYVLGSERRLQSDGRLHPTFTHKPSTFRLSCVNPNLQNVATERAGTSIKGFRECIVAAPGCVLVEADFSGIEAVETGWYTRDAQYIRLARLGVHGYVASHLVKRPVDLSWSDKDIAEALSEIKNRYPEEYDRAKRTVHGTNYGLSVYGLVLNYPDKFDRVSANNIQRLYLDLCPRLGPWQREVRDLAHKRTYLGGADHPFGYRHDFWDVYSPKVPNSRDSSEHALGPDAKRVVAYYPQSTSAGVLYEACLRLMDQDSANYIGDFYYGQSPIRALIHDSILCEVPLDKAELLIERLVNEMTRPIIQQPMSRVGHLGNLVIGVEVKQGADWGNMKKVISVQGVSSDLAEMAQEEEDEIDN